MVSVSPSDDRQHQGDAAADRRRRRDAMVRRRLRRVPFVRRVLYRLRWLLGHSIFSSLTRRIVFLNLVALIVLVSGILYLNQFRAGLIDARVESLLTQGEIIAAAIASSTCLTQPRMRLLRALLMAVRRAITRAAFLADGVFAINSLRNWAGQGFPFMPCREIPKAADQ